MNDNSFYCRFENNERFEKHRFRMDVDNRAPFLLNTQQELDVYLLSSFLDDR